MQPGALAQASALVSAQAPATAAPVVAARGRWRRGHCHRGWHHGRRALRARGLQHIAADGHAVAVVHARFFFVHERAIVHGNGQHRAHVAQHRGTVVVEAHGGLQARDLALLVGQHEVVVGAASDRSPGRREQGRRARRHRPAGMFDHCPAHGTSVFSFCVFRMFLPRPARCDGAAARSVRPVRSCAAVNASFAWRPRTRGPTPGACARPRSGRRWGTHRGACGTARGIRGSGWPRSS
jgi:hypothetical protein